MSGRTEREAEPGIRVRIRLVGVFQRGRPQEADHRFPAGCTVGQAVQSLDLPDALLGIYLRNGVHADGADQLQDGDALTILPIVDGG